MAMKTWHLRKERKEDIWDVFDAPLEGDMKEMAEEFLEIVARLKVRHPQYHRFEIVSHDPYEHCPTFVGVVWETDEQWAKRVVIIEKRMATIEKRKSPTT